MKFNLTFTQTEITPAKQHALTHFQEHMNLKGFRPGKAPLAIVEKNTDPEKLITEVINHLVPEKYSQHIKNNKLKPIAQPRIKIVSADPSKDWEVEVKIAEKPQVTLGKYQDELKTLKSKSPIWKKVDAKKAKADKEPESDTVNEDKKLSSIFDKLLEICQVEVPEMLIEEEVDRALSRLISQVEKLGLTIDRYLSSMGKTPETITQEYKATAQTQLKLEFIMDAIISDLKLEVSQEEIDKILNTLKPDQQTALRKNVVEMATLRYSLAKQKAVETLMNL